MMEGNPNWWSLNNIMRSQASPISPSSSIFDNQATTSDSDHTSNSNSYADGQEEFPQSWSQLLMGGMANDQEEDGNNPPRQLQLGKNMETSDWEYHHETLNPLSNLRFLSVAPSILEVDHHHARDVNSYNHTYDHKQQETLVLDHTCQSNSSTTHVTNDNPNSSYESYISNSNSLGMSNAKKSVVVSRKQQITEHGSTSTKMVTGGGVYKKPRVQSSSQPPLRVRKELGDRITALHQIVSPFGKTDTASVLLEAIGYIRFLQGQIQALVSPYLDSSGILSSNMRHHHPHSVQGERNYAFHFDQEDGVKDLRSKGLCLVPISCINDIQSGIKGAADFWVTPAPGLGNGGGGF